jgi:hypothetical protein
LGEEKKIGKFFYWKLFKNFESKIKLFYKVYNPWKKFKYKQFKINFFLSSPSLISIKHFKEKSHISHKIFLLIDSSRKTFRSELKSSDPLLILHHLKIFSRKFLWTALKWKLWRICI